MANKDGVTHPRGTPRLAPLPQKAAEEIIFFVFVYCVGTVFFSDTCAVFRFFPKPWIDNKDISFNEWKPLRRINSGFRKMVSEARDTFPFAMDILQLALLFKFNF